MLSIRRINPMARAIGTMGAVVALAGGITFAALQSNTVALSPNTLDSATANLSIGLTNTGTCADRNAGPRTGLNLTGANAMVPGVPSTPFPFCLVNTGTVPLNLTTAIPQAAFSASPINPNQVTLNMTCTNGGNTSGTLDQYTGGTPVGTLNPAAEADCTASVTLNAGFSGSGGGSVSPFAIEFVGNQ